MIRLLRRYGTISHLPNGIKCVSVDSPGHFVSVGAFINAGSRVEDTRGLSHFIDRMSFKSTKDFTSQQLISSLESIGGNFMSTSTKEAISYQCTLFRHDLEKFFPLLSSMILSPLYLSEEMEETKDAVRYEISELQRKWDIVLPEKLHKIAFKNGALVNSVGKSTLCEEEDLSGITSEALHRYRALWYTPNRMVIAGVGLDHSVLTDYAMKYFGSMPLIDKNIIDYQNTLYEKAKYYGGTEFIDTNLLNIERHPDDIPLTHVYLGFEGISMTDPDAYSLATLAILLGGGGSFSAGGPGKGMYTKLYRQVLNRHYWVENCNHLNAAYSDTGLFALTASVPPSADTHNAVLPILCDQLVSLTKPVSQVELNRAKNQLKSQILMAIESKTYLLEDIAKQALHYGTTIDIKETCRRIDMVEAQDLVRVIRRVVFGEDLTSRFDFGDQICKPWSRTGDGKASLLVYGPLTKDDPIYESDRVLREWGIQKGSTQKRKRFSNLFRA